MKTSESIRERSARTLRFVTIVWVASALLVVLERFSLVTIRLVQSGFAVDALRAFACQAASAVPEALFLWGLWGVRGALAEFSRGVLFARPVTHMLNRVATVLVWGAAVRIAVVPGICRLLGEDIRYWISFDAASLALGGMGLALRAIAGVLLHASVIQSELDEIF